MAQIVKLRRSSVSGQKPTNTNLQLGELAQNTTDGKIFLAKSGSGGPSIEEIIVTNTSNTGSINLLGSVSASNFTGSFTGDGALLYNIPASGVTGLQLDRISSGNVSASISPATGLVINTGVTITGSVNATQFTGSGLGLTNVPFHISGSDVDGGTYDKQFTKLQFDDSTGLNVSESVAGTAFISIGSHFRDIFVSGSDMLRATGSDAFEIIPEGGVEVTTSITDTNSNGYVKELRLSTTTLSSSLDTRISNLSGSVVYQSETSSMTVLSSSYALTASFALNAGAGAEGRTYIHTQSSASTTWTVTHNLGESYPAIVVFDSLDNVIVPGNISVVDDTTFIVTFTSAQSGKVSATVGGGLPHISASYVGYVLATDGDSPSWKSGIISGSSQIILTGTTGYSAFSSSISSSIGALSASIAATDLLDDQRLDAIESTTSSLNSYTSSTNGRLDAIETSTGSLNTFSSSTLTRLSSLETASGSIRTDFNTFTSSYTTVSSSLDSRLDVLEAYSSSQQVPTASMSFRTLQTDVYCKNVTGVQINKGTVVRIVGATGDNPLIGPADLLTEGNSANTLGIATQDIPNDSFGLIITEGILTGVNTNGMTAGALLFLGANGTFTTTPPVAPNHGVRLGEVLRVQQNNGSIYVRIDNGIELNEAHDVIYTGITTGDLLIRSGSVWINSKQLTGSYHITGSINATSLTGSINYNNLTNVPTLVSGSSQILLTGTTGYSTFSSSIATTTLNIETRVGSLETESGSVRTALNNYTSSTNSRLSSIETSTGSLNTFTSSANGRLSALETESGSVRSTLNSYTSSNDSTNTTQNNRLTSLEGKTGSYATTGSNIFLGNQIVTGSLYISQDLIVAGSSSIQHISSSIVNIADNIITVNAQNPSIRFGGLAVIDSGSSPQVSGSILFDSVNNQWIFIHQNQSTITSSVLLMGPETYNNPGSEGYLTQNRLPKGSGIEHLYDSNITDTGTKVSINSNTEITGTFVVTGTALVSGSSQINHNTTTNYVANQHIDHTTVSISAGNGLSGGGDISATRTLTLDTGSAHFSGGVKSKMNTDGVISGSAQVVAALPSGTVSGSSQVLNGSGVWSGSAQLPSGVVSGSSQVSFNGITDKPALVSGSSQVSFSGLSGVPSGLVSGSSQVSYTGLSNIPSGIVSGSSQVSFSGLSGVPSGLVSGSSQVLNGSGVWSGSAQLPSGVVSGSSQVSFSGLSGVPSGLVSGSSQISFGSISGVPSGLVSGSSQISFGSISGVPSGLVSGSSQISFGSISGVPSGLVSGSSQIAIASTSGFSTYLNQAVLTSSAPTFNGLTVNGASYFAGSIGNTPAGVGVHIGISAGNDGQIQIIGPSAHIDFANANSEDFDARLILTGNDTISFEGVGASGLQVAGQTVWNAGNDGSGSGLDADLWDGYQFSSYLNQAVLTSSSPTFSSIYSSASGGFYLGDTGAGLYRDNTYDVVLTQNNSSGGVTYISGAGNVIVSIDNNNNETDRKFIVGSNGVKATNELFSVNESGVAFASNDFRAPIFYDSNDTGYYGDFASTSRINALETLGRVVIGGYFSNNAYNSVGSSRLHFGGGDSDANSNYYIGTNLENYGGNYTKLDLRWHTGIRMGAQPGYGGIRFYDTEDLGTVLFSIGTGDSNVRSHTNLIPSANNSYNLGSASLGWANVYTNDLHLSNMNKPEGNDIDGTNGNWTIQEGAENLYIINNNNGKKYKISLEEI